MTETRTLNIAFGAVIKNANGGSGDDELIGNDIGNVLSGLVGADTLDGGGGDDTLSGGAGADVFLFDALADLTANTDHITDFDVSDSLDFSGIGGLTFTGTGFFNSSPGEVRFYLQATSTIFEIDSNGDAIADHRFVRHQINWNRF